MKPTIPANIILPVEDSPAGNWKCGESYQKTVTVTRPYLGTNNHEIELEPIDWKDYESVGDVLVSVRKLRGELNASNRRAIDKILQRADGYLKIAAQLEGWWLEEYSLSPTGPDANSRGGWKDESKQARVTGWPFTQSTYPGCQGRGYGEPVRFAPDLVARCPSYQDQIDHQRDKEAWESLMRAAAINARCAQEAAWAVVLYRRNRADRGQGLTTPKPTPHPPRGPSGASADLGPLTPPPPQSPEIAAPMEDPVPPDSDPGPDPGAEPEVPTGERTEPTVKDFPWGLVAATVVFGGGLLYFLRRR